MVGGGGRLGGLVYPLSLSVGTEVVWKQVGLESEP